VRSACPLHGDHAYRCGTSDFGLALVAGLFAFGGWHMLTYNAGEAIAGPRSPKQESTCRC